MGFNFSAFLGGMGEQISTNIEEAKKFNREKDFRLEMLAEEEATKMRLAKADEKKLQRKNDKILAGKLKAANYDAGRSAYIMAQGSGYAEEMLTLASQAHTNNLDPNTILKYADGIEEMRLMVGSPGSRTLQFPTDFDYTDAFIQDTDIMTSVRTPQSDAKDTLKKMRAQVLGKMANLDPAADKDVYDKLSEKANFYLEEMVKEAGDIAKKEAEARATDETPEKLDILPNSEITSMLKNITDRIAPTYNLTSFEGSFENLETGMQGVSLVARIDSALLVKEQASGMYDGLDEDRKENIFNNNAPSRMNAEINAAVQDLKTLANTTYQSSLVSTGTDLGKKFKGSYTDGDVEGVFKTAEQQASEDRTLIYGDTVEINGELAIYTGFVHTYGNWQEANTGGYVPQLPFVFESDDSKYQVTATRRVN